MSKFARAILSHNTGSRVYIQEKFDFSDYKQDDKFVKYIDPVYGEVMECGVQISMKTRYNKIDNGHDILQKVKQAIINDVFGEFRVLTDKLSINIYNRDFQSAQATLKELELKLYTEV